MENTGINKALRVENRQSCNMYIKKHMKTTLEKHDMA